MSLTSTGSISLDSTFKDSTARRINFKYLHVPHDSSYGQNHKIVLVFLHTPFINNEGVD